MKRTKLFRNGVVALFLSSSLWAGAAEKVTFEDHVAPIFRNRCGKCHNSNDLKGNLDVMTFSGVLRGGGGGEIVASGDPESSKLIGVMTHDMEPTMPPNSGPVAKAEVDIVRKWIAGGMLETSGSKAIAASAPKMDFTVGASDIGKPEGPPAMPKDWLLEPFVRTERTSAILCVASSPWAPLVALAGQKQVLLYNTDTLELAGVIPFKEGFPTDIKFSRNGKLLLVGGGYGAQLGIAAVYDVTTGERVITVGEEFDSVLAADLSADQKFIALGGPSRLVKIYSTQSGKMTHSMKKHTDWVTAAEFSPNGKLLATGDRGGNIFVWDSASGENLYTLRGHRGAIKSVSWRADSEALITSSEDASIRMWKVADEEQVRSITAHRTALGGVQSARYTHNGNFVSVGRDANIQTWNGSGGKIKTIKAIQDIPVCATFSHDGKLVIAGDWAGNVGVWNAADGKLVGKLDSNPPFIVKRLEDAAKTLAASQAAAKKDAGKVAQSTAAVKAAKTEADKKWAESKVGRVASLAKQADELNRQIAEAADQELARLKAEADKKAAAKKAADTNVTTLKATLAKTDKTSATYKDVVAKLDAAKKQAAAASKQADATVKAMSEISAKSLAAAQAEAKKVTDALSKANKDAKSLTVLAQQAAAANKKATDAATAQLTKLQSEVAATLKTLAAAEAESTKLAEQLKKTEKTSKTYVDLQKKIEAAGKNSVAAKAAADAAQKNLAGLQKVGGAAKTTLTAAKGDAGKLVEALKVTDPVYHAHLAAVKKTEAANKQLADAKAALSKSQKAVEVAQSKVNHWKAAQFNVQVYAARAELEKKQMEFAVLKAEATDAETAALAARQALKKAQADLAAVPDKLNGLRNVAKFDQQWVDDANANVKKAEAASAKLVASLKSAEAQLESAKAAALAADKNAAEIAELRKEIASSEKTAAEQKAVADKAKSQVDSVRKSLAKAAAEAKTAAEAAEKSPKDEKLIAAAKAKDGEVVTQKGWLMKVEAALANARAAADTSAEGVADLKEEYARSQGDKAEMTAKMAAAASEAQAKKVAKLKADIAASAKAVAAAKAAVKPEMDNLAKSKKAIADAEAAAKKLPEMVKAAEAKAKAADAALAKAKAAATAAEKVAGAQEQKVAQMAKEYRKMTGQPEPAKDAPQQAKAS